MNAVMRPPDHPPDDDGHDLLTSGEVAKMLRITRRTAERWARTGRLPAVRVGRQWRFPRDKIERIARMRDWDESHWT